MPTVAFLLWVGQCVSSALKRVAHCADMEQGGSPVVCLTLCCQGPRPDVPGKIFFCDSDSLSKSDQPGVPGACIFLAYLSFTNHLL